MKQTTKNLNNRKHLHIHKLNNSQLRATKGGEIITCGLEGDLCKTLTVTTGFANKSHRIVIASKSATAE